MQLGQEAGLTEQPGTGVAEGALPRGPMGPRTRSQRTRLTEPSPLHRRTHRPALRRPVGPGFGSEAFRKQRPPSRRSKRELELMPTTRVSDRSSGIWAHPTPYSGSVTSQISAIDTQPATRGPINPRVTELAELARARPRWRTAPGSARRLMLRIIADARRQGRRGHRGGPVPGDRAVQASSR